MKKIIASVLLFALMLTACMSFASCQEPKNNKVKVIDLVLSEEEYAFAVAKNNDDLLNKVNAFLTKIKTNGTFDAICNNYFGDGTPLAITSATLDESKDQLVVATSTGFEPFEMVSADGKYSGVDLEIAYYLAQELNLELVIQDMDFTAVLTSVETGKSDIAMAGLTVKPDRQEIVNFTDTYYNAGQVVICMEDDDTFKDCKTGAEVAAILAAMGSDKKIGCQEGTTGELYIKGDEDYGFAGLKVTAAGYKYGALAITAMINGQVNYVILDNGPAKAMAEKLNGN